MNTSEIIYKGELRTNAVHLRSGQQIITDAPVDNNGKGEAFSPTDLLATSLGCCMLTVMGIMAKRHSIDVDGTKVEIVKVMADNPRRVSEVQVEIHFPKNTYTDKDKQLLENTALACPVAKSLHPDIKQKTRFHF
ncbi:MAG: OsmC family peroxiredoxin [Bacteroidetes bacterium]|nr:MAG: OsmC family peroxiredoxin [Bacteroidota bacterium]